MIAKDWSSGRNSAPLGRVAMIPPKSPIAIAAALDIATSTA